jgi:hypothetical protein
MTPYAGSRSIRSRAARRLPIQLTHRTSYTDIVLVTATCNRVAVMSCPNHFWFRDTSARQIQLAPGNECVDDAI